MKTRMNNLVAVCAAMLMLSAASAAQAVTLDNGDILATSQADGALYHYDASASFTRTAVSTGGAMTGTVWDVEIESSTSALIMSNGDLTRIDLTGAPASNQTVLVSSTMDIHGLVSSADKQTAYTIDDNPPHLFYEIPLATPAYNSIAPAGVDEFRDGAIDGTTGTKGTMYWTDRDAGGGQVYVRDMDAGTQSALISGLTSPTGILLDPEAGPLGSILVMRAGPDLIDRYSSAGTFIETVTGGNFLTNAGNEFPYYMDWEPGGTFLVQDNTGQLIRVDPSSPSLTGTNQTLVDGTLGSGNRGVAVFRVESTAAIGTPEPSTAILAVLGLVSLVLTRRRRRGRK